jgi:hypothetical protein
MKFFLQILNTELSILPEQRIAFSIGTLCFKVLLFTFKDLRGMTYNPAFLCANKTG